jgi:hypothetical protein
MVGPPVEARVEQANHRQRIGIDSGDVRPFVAIAVDSGKSQVVGMFRAAVPFGDDVVDLEWKELSCCGEPAVFTTPGGSFANRLDDVRVHVGEVPDSTKARRAFDCMIARRLPTWI